MFPSIIKRDATVSQFDKSRIVIAVVKAAVEAKAEKPSEIADKVTSLVCAELIGKEEIRINEVTSLVEDKLMLIDSNVARHYVEFRHDRDVARERNTSLYKDITGLIEHTNSAVLNENANKDSKILPTQRDLLAGTVAKAYAKTHILPRDIVEAHECGDIHYHDLDYAPFTKGMFNCMLVDLEGMLTKGFRMGNADIESPKSIATATAVTAQIIAQVASHIYGGTTIHRIDQVLAPYVTASYKKHLETAEEWNVSDKEAFAVSLTEKECQSAFQALEYEVNTLQSANGQTPFVTFGISGFDTSWEARLITQCIFKQRMLGLGKEGKTPVFPKLVYTIREGFNTEEGEPNYDMKQLAIECATKRMYPDILNYQNLIDITGSYKTPMGCRSFLSPWQNEEGEYVHEGRNNLGVISVNLPRIAIQAKGNVDEFWKILEDRLELSKRALMTRIERFEGVTADVAPILYMSGACGVRLNAKDPIMPIFENGRATISLGYIGVHEMVNALFGTDEHIFDTKERQDFAQSVVQRLRNACDQWKEETKFGFGLYSTPSENLCNRFAAIDSKEFGIIEGVTDNSYYTNSYHLCVAKEVTAFEKLDYELPYPAIANGGFINYVEMPNMQNNPKGLEDIWDYSRKIGIAYFGGNSPIDECYECGFEGEFSCTSKGFECPHCGNNNPTTVSVTRRVCGYLGSPDARPFNHGKQIEVKRRVKHFG